MTAGNDKKELRPGEKFLVTVQEVLHNTLIVYLEYRKVKFCGALLNTTNRRAPYGIKENPAESYYQAYGIDPKTITTQEKEELEKARVISAPQFPLPIDTRTTYAQKLHLPPPRQIHHRRRRSKRKVRMDMMDTDLAFKLMTNGSNQKLHSDTCCCDRCVIQSTGDNMNEEKPLKGKRKLLRLSPKMNLKRKSSGSYDDMTAIPEKSKQNKLELGSTAVSRLKKRLLESSNAASTSVKRSPVIKISYKAPGGKGQVLEIPSKVHSPALRIGETTKNAMQERARKAVIRAKSEHFKFLQDQKQEEQNDQKQAVSQANSKSVKFADAQVVTSTGVSLRGKESTNTKTGSAAIESETNDEKNPSGKEVAGKVFTEQEKGPVSGSKEPANSSKRLLRSLVPQVLISPISKGSDEEDVSSSPSPQSAEKQHDGAAASDDNMQSLSPKKKDTSKISHTISVTRCTTRNGVKWCQGDVVWGKIHGFPWWPGLLQRIIVKKGQDSLEQIAIVDWFQSKTISHIPCSQLESFSGNFNKRYSKKLKGNYKKAIQEAHEAEKNMSREVRKLIMQFET